MSMRLADAFMTGPLREGALECTNAKGHVVRFDPRTEEFGVLGKDGKVLTFMVVRPLPSAQQTSLQYFQSQCQ
jgi:filamentous hemagglutinin